MFRFLCFLLLTSSLWAQKTPSIEVQLQSSFLVEREETVLTVTVRNLPTSGWPSAPNITPLSLRQAQHSNMFINGRVSESFTYVISSMKSGVFEIPPFRFGRVSSNTTTLTVVSADQLHRGEVIINGQTHPYLSGTLISNPRPYLGQAQPIEAKLYLPTRIRVENPRYADFTKKDAVAWRFDPTSNGGGIFRSAGETYRAFSYHSVITPLKEGAISFGPGTVDPVIQFKVMQRGRLYWQRQQVEFKFSALQLTALPLPKPAPPGFAGAVGNFQLSASTLGKEVSVGDPLTVELSISGTGNLDQLPAPQLLDDDKQFKQFEIVKKPQGNERRSATGTVEFSQVIRPMQVTKTIPPYELVFFDPVLQQYRIALTPTIPLVVTPAKIVGRAAVSASSQSENGFLTPGSRIIPASATRAWPIWLWQLIPALIALGLIFKKLRPKLQEQKQQSHVEKEFEEDLQGVKQSQTRIELYREAGQVITRWPEKSETPEIQSIIETRDEICFSPDEQPEKLLPKERNSVLKLLQQLAPLLLISLAWLPFDLKAENWKEVIAENPTPESFHNLGLVEEQEERPHTAALYYYRYLAYGGDSERIDRLLSTTGGFRLRKPIGIEHLTWLPASFYSQCGIAALWGLALIVLVLMNKAYRWSFLLIPLTLIAGSLWVLAINFYPKDVSFRPLTELSVLMEEATLKKTPYKGADTGRKVPATSVGLVNGTSGEWAHIEFPGGIKGWLPQSSLAPIAGRDLWNPPSAQKD